MSLVLSRKQEEAIVIGDDIVVRVIAIRGDKIKLAIDAPREVTIDREEVRERKERHARQG